MDLLLVLKKKSIFLAFSSDYCASLFIATHSDYSRILWS